MISEPEPHRVAASTIEAFKYVVRQNDPEQLRAWLARHPEEREFLAGMLQNEG